MAEKSTWIKIDRNIMDWRWYKDNNTKCLFLHLLLKANIKPHGFRNVTIKRGELATSYATLAAETGMTIHQVRVALEHLQMTGEIAIKRHSRFTVISMPNYDLYQSQTADRWQTDAQTNDNQMALKWQQSKNDKKEKKEKNIYTPTAKTEEQKDASSLREDYGGVWLTAEEYNELEGMVEDKMAFLDVLDRVGEWLADNPRAKTRHKGVVKTFLRNDGLI